MSRRLLRLCVPSLLLSCTVPVDEIWAGKGEGSVIDDRDGAGDAPYVPDLVCPGSAGCEDASGELRVGAASAVITPSCFESWTDLDADAELDDEESFLDCGCDRLCPADEGYTGPDEGEGDGEFQAVWVAGFQNNRPASGVHDDMYARAIVFDQGSTRVAVVSVDLVGWFLQDVVAVRQELARRGADVDYVLIASTHTHQGPDTMGLWGRTESRSGVDPDYLTAVHTQTADAVEAAIAGLKPLGELRVGTVDISTYPRGVYNYLADHRAPNIIDYRFHTAIFRDADGGTLATLAYFANHPEDRADENSELSSDYAATLRQTLEQGVVWEAYSRAGLGGTAIFLNGPVGGMMSSLGIDITDPDGNTYDGYSWPRTEALGKMMGELGLDAVESSTVVESPSIRLAVESFYLPVENYGFQAMFLSGIIERELFHYDPSEPIDEGNTPDVQTELAWLRIGELELLTVPGELFPESAIGCYEGGCTGSEDTPIVDEGNEDPPDLASAPAGPYLYDRMQGRHPWIIGLGNDQLGYILPPYDFKLDPVNPWFDEPPGDHYEETNSLGPQTEPLYVAQVDALLTYVYAQ